MQARDRAHAARWSGALLLALLALVAVAGCGHYEPPPEAWILGTENGVLFDTRAPIELGFSQPIDPSTLNVKLVKFETDIEGNLFDESGDPTKKLTIYFEHDADPEMPEVGGKSELIAGGTILRIHMVVAPPIGTELAMVIEAGLSDLDGHVVKYRQRLLFGYRFRCTGKVGTKVVPEHGTYYMLIQVDKPVATQIRLWAPMTVDPASGRFIGQFTDAVRNRDPNRCNPPCSSTEACRTLPDPPGPHCVIPSEKAGSTDEYPDWVPNDVPPSGFTFTVEGCIEDQSPTTAAWANAPVEIAVQQPPVTAQGTHMSQEFSVGSDGVLRATGSFTSDNILLGIVASGGGTGSTRMRLVPEDEVPPGIPPAPPLPPADLTSDGGL